MSNKFFSHPKPPSPVIGDPFNLMHNEYRDAAWCSTQHMHLEQQYDEEIPIHVLSFLSTFILLALRFFFRQTDRHFLRFSSSVTPFPVYNFSPSHPNCLPSFLHPSTLFPIPVPVKALSCTVESLALVPVVGRSNVQL